MSGEIEIYDPPADDGGADYILQIKVKNGPLLRALRSHGFQNGRQFAQAHKIGEGVVGDYLALRLAPMNKKGQWRASILQIARALHLPPDVLFPEQHIEQALARSSGELEISKAEIATLLEPNDSDEAERREQIAQTLDKILTGLPSRTQKILRLRYGLDGSEPLSLRETGEKFGVQAETVRQIEQKAFRNLRHPDRVKMLAEAGSHAAEMTLAEYRRRERELAARGAEQRRRDKEREERKQRGESVEPVTNEEQLAARAAEIDAERRNHADEQRQRIRDGLLWAEPEPGHIARMFEFIFMRERDLPPTLEQELIAEGWTIEARHEGIVRLLPPNARKHEPTK